MGMVSELLRLCDDGAPLGEDNPWHKADGKFGLDNNKGVWSLYFSKPGTARAIGVKGKKGVKKKNIKAMCGRSDRSVVCKVSARFKKAGRKLPQQTPASRAARAATKQKRSDAAKSARG